MSKRAPRPQEQTTVVRTHHTLDEQEQVPISTGAGSSNAFQESASEDLPLNIFDKIGNFLSPKKSDAKDSPSTSTSPAAPRAASDGEVPIESSEALVSEPLPEEEDIENFEEAQSGIFPLKVTDVSQENGANALAGVPAPVHSTNSVVVPALQARLQIWNDRSTTKTTPTVAPTVAH